MPKDYYDILGVNKSADQSEIKRAFRKQAKKYHPDTKGDSKNSIDKFREIVEAYNYLLERYKKWIKSNL